MVTWSIVNNANDPLGGGALIPWSIFPHYLRARETEAQQVRLGNRSLVRHPCGLHGTHMYIHAHSYACATHVHARTHTHEHTLLFHPRLRRGVRSMAMPTAMADHPRTGSARLSST